MNDPTAPLRIGILGAARITVESLVAPARDGLARLVVVAARDQARAARFAADHAVERAVGSYREVLDDPEVEVVYNALPNSLHGPWNLAAIRAGKHVLTEKPFASNAAEARTVADAAAAAGLVVFDAFHYRYHPVFHRFTDVATGGEIGRLRSLQVRMLMPAPEDDDLRWSLSLAGGAMMDLGCYALHVINTIAGALGGKPELLSSTMGERDGRPGIDESYAVELRLPGGVRASAVGDMANAGWEFSLTATGDRGSVVVPNFVKVSSDDRLILRPDDGPERVEHLGTRSSYHYQLDALTAAVRRGVPYPTDAADGLVNLEQIDACYTLAGLKPRPADTPRRYHGRRMA